MMSNTIGRLFNKITFNNRDISFLIKGSGIVFVMQIFSMVFRYGVQIALAQWAGEIEYGQYVYVYSWTQLLAVLIPLGVATSGLKLIPIYSMPIHLPKLKGFIVFSLLLVAAMSMFVALVTGIYSFVVHELNLTLLIAIGVVPFLALVSTFSDFIRAQKKIIEANLPLQFVAPGILLLLSFSVPYQGKVLTAKEIIVFAAISFLITFCVVAYLFYRNLPAGVWMVSSQFESKKWLTLTLPLFLVSGAFMALNQIDILMVGSLIDSTNAGIYSVASRIALLAGFGVVAIQSVIAPIISEKYANKDFENLQNLVAWSSLIMTVVTLGLGLILILSGEHLLAFWGARFTEGKMILFVLILSQVINSLTGPVSILLSMTGNQNILGIILIATFIFAVPLNFIGISWFNSTGAALATLLVNASWNIVAMIFIYKKLNIVSRFQLSIVFNKNPL